MIKIKERLNSFLTNLLKKNDSQSKFMLGSIFLDNAKKKYESIKDLNEVEFKVFSQTGEDGIIDFLISKLGILNSKFVEIGVGDYSEANTRYIYEKSFSKGLIIDIEKDFKRKVSKNINLWKGLLEIENIEISTENINKILDKYHLNEKLDLFSIDIDGIDYWVIEKLKKKISKIFVAEYNPTFGHNLEISVPNKKNFNRFQEHYSGCYYGASLKAIIRLLEKKGYDFVGTNKLNFNAFFVESDLSHNFQDLKKNLKSLDFYTEIKIRDSKNKNGQLDFLSREKRLEQLKELEIIDLSHSEKKKYKINDIIKNI
jgi:hypothetical protein